MSGIFDPVRVTDATYAPSGLPDVICLSHLRWDFVYQRPQHLMSRFARERRIYFFEEPVFGEGPASLDIGHRENGLHVVVPHLCSGIGRANAENCQRDLLDRLIEVQGIGEYILWYYTPMALGFTRQLSPLATVYDSMDELSAFRGAPPALVEREAELFTRADVVFVGGRSLYEAKRHRHSNVYLLPSSIDTAHFGQARTSVGEPADQAAIPHPRLGYCGVIDERMDTGLLAAIAEARPDWNLVMIGPLAKIDSADLPRRPNLHYLGGKPYTELPRYFAGWDVALMPWARNESTRFISPTKTPEYLAAGKPVVSTPIPDVVHPYGEEKLVRIAATVQEFVREIEMAMRVDARDEDWLRRVDAHLGRSSWDRTWRAMHDAIDTLLAAPRGASDMSLERADALPQRATPERAMEAAD